MVNVLNVTELYTLCFVYLIIILKKTQKKKKTPYCMILFI